MRITRNDGKDYLEYREGQNDTTEIYDIAVTTDRRNGIASDMLQELEDTVGGHIYAFTRESNAIARVFYKKRGFRSQLVPGFYPDENAILVVKKV